MQPQSTTPPSSSSEPIDYRSVKVHDFRPGSVTVIAVVGVAVAVAWILLQLFVTWKNDPSSSYALGQILGLLLLILFIVGFCSSLCCLSLRPWARPGLFIYSIAGGGLMSKK